MSKIFAMETLSLTDIPDAYLSNLARRYLPPADLVNLCDSHSNFEFLKLYLPEYLELEGERFMKRGPRDGHFCPEPYFLSPVMNQRVRSIKMSFRWKDQGYGNRKGMLWIELLRGSEIIASSYDDFQALAPHKEETREVVIKDHPVVDKIRKGDVLQFMRNIGGGGGHSLTVEDFKVKLELIKF